MTHSVGHGGNGSNGASGYEHREANLKLIVYSAIGLAAVVAVVMVLMFGTFELLKLKDKEGDEERASHLAAPFQVPPDPRLEEHPWESMQALRAQEEHTLTTYGWQDQKAGVVRIPIQKAMDLIAQRGLPVNTQQGNNQPAHAARGIGSRPATGNPPAAQPGTNPGQPRNQGANHE
ncbi:MAG: hypothetical protein JO022_04050 [Acidobacteriaceae bacterium]|nr:hypothetical protein [Acidobacteriaceae bacterium]